MMFKWRCHYCNHSNDKNEKRTVIYEDQNRQTLQDTSHVASFFTLYLTFFNLALILPPTTLNFRKDVT